MSAGEKEVVAEEQAPVRRVRPNVGDVLEYPRADGSTARWEVTGMHPRTDEVWVKPLPDGQVSA
jgi:hypothetical protein